MMYQIRSSVMTVTTGNIIALLIIERYNPRCLDKSRKSPSKLEPYNSNKATISCVESNSKKRESHTLLI